MRITIDISQLTYPNTGVAVYTSQLAKYLLAIDKTNEYILFGNSLRSRSTLDKFYFDCSNNRTNVSKRFYPIPQSILQILWNQVHLANIEFFTGEIDLFHSSDWVEPPAKAKKVTTVHDLLIYKYPEYIHPHIVANQKRKLEWVKKESQLIIADSQSTKNDIIEYLKIPEGKIRVVYLGINDQFKPQTKEKIDVVKKKYHLPTDYILSIGTQEPRKNINRVIEAYRMLNKNDVHLVIVGRYVWGEKPKETHNIHFLESVEYVDLPSFYAGAQCFVYPSLYEGFGLPILEAMACYCPVATSKRGSLNEIVGKSVILVEPEEVESIAAGINKIIDGNKSIIDELVIRAAAWAKQFSWEKTAKQTLKVYKEVLS